MRRYLVYKPGPILACIIKGPLCNIKNENVQH